MSMYDKNHYNIVISLQLTHIFKKPPLTAMEIRLYEGENRSGETKIDEYGLYSGVKLP